MSYEMIDRFLRNNLHDDDYAEYSAALDAVADDAARLAREAEAHYWRSMVERLTEQTDEWNRRYIALLQQVADGRAMQPPPALYITIDKTPKG
jgi:hypothetical protein